MRILIVSRRGESLGLGVRLQQEGHKVCLFCRDSRSRSVGKDILVGVSSLEEGLAHAPELILFDFPGMGKQAEKLRQGGHKVIGGGIWNDRMELDQKFLVRAMESFGIQSPVSYAFQNFMDAAKYLTHAPKRLMFKPTGMENRSYYGQSQDDTIAYITRLVRSLKIDGPCILQDYKHGVELYTEIWFSRGKPLAYPIGAILARRLAPAMGPTVDPQAALVWCYDKREPRAVQQSLKKAYLLMDKIGYSGPLGINGIVSNGRFWGLGFVSRPNPWMLYAYLRLLQEPSGSFLSRCVDGSQTPISADPSLFSLSSLVHVPPYPYEGESPAGQLIGGITKKEWSEEVFPIGVQSARAGLMTSDGGGAVLALTGTGANPWLASDGVGYLFRKLELPGKTSRFRDFVPEAQTSIDLLRSMRYDIPSFNIPQTIAVEGGKK